MVNPHFVFICIVFCHPLNWALLRVSHLLWNIYICTAAKIKEKKKKTNEIILSKLEEKEIYTPQMAMNLERSTTPQIVQYSVLLLKKTLHRKGGQSNQLIIRK